MKGRSIILASVVALAVSQVQAQNVVLTSDAQKVGYAIGADLGKNLEEVIKINGKNSIDVDNLVSGLHDVLDGNKLAMSNEEIADTMHSFAEKSMDAMNVKRNEEALQNAQAGNRFLAENAKKSGVKTTESGLQYKVIKEGRGVKPNKEDLVTVTYKGSLIDGTVFDSTEKNNGGKSVTFGILQVIPGWVEGLQLMREGSEYQFYIPSDLAYGKQGAGAVIPPNSTLIFDVTLEKVTPTTEDK